MSRLVPGSGNPLAKIVLVGEAPGRREEETGQPFVGGAGQMLDAILRSSGLMRSNLYITNVVKIRPANNDFSIFYVGRQPTNDLLEWRGKLLNELAAIRPNVIVPMGNEALAAVMNIRGITNWRGSILWSKAIGMKVIPAVHPAFILRGQWEMMPITVLDFKRIKEQSMFPEYRVKMPNLIVTQSKEHSLGLLDEMIKSKTPVVVDIETTRDGNCSITAIGFSNSPEWGFSIPMVAWQGNKWQQEDEIDIWLRIKVLLESTTVAKIMQNAQFDMYVLKVVTGIMTKNLWMDTMVAQFDCYPELPKGLDTLASIYTELPYWKHQIKENLCEYNAMDAVGTYQVAMELDKELEECHVKDLYYKRDHPLLEPIMEMQLRGVRMDMDKRKVAATIVRGQISEIEKRLYSKVGIVNINSPKQVATLLYEKLKLPKQFKRGTTKLTTDEGAINKLSAKYPSEELDWILELRGLSKLVSTYLESALDDDNRIRSSYMVGGTLTGRLSSSQTVFKTGGNLQNIPPGICREIFLPDIGKVLGECDLSQAESRVVAWLAKDEKMIRMFAEGGDIHKKMASLIYDKNVEDVTKAERQIAKTAGHASNYMIGIKKFAAMIQRSPSEATRIQDKYYSTFPRIRLWHAMTEDTIRRTRTLITPLGRRRVFYGMITDDLVREAVAYVPQSTVADALNTALLSAWNVWKSNDVQLLLQVHDSFVFQFKLEDISSVKLTLKHAFDVKIPIGGNELVIPYEFKSGINWSAMKEVI